MKLFQVSNNEFIFTACVWPTRIVADEVRGGVTRVFDEW